MLDVGTETQEVEIISDGKYRYQVIRNWLKPTTPGGAHPCDVAVDSRDRVFISVPQDRRGDKGLIESADMPLIFICDSEGNQIDSWGTGATISAHGLHIANDMLYVCDKDASKCLIYTLDGKILRVIGEHRVHADTGAVHKGDPVTKEAGPFNYPAQIVPSPWGDLYVADGYKNARVHRFHSNGQLIQSWGKWGRKGAGNFHLPHAVLATGDGRVYVASRFGNNVQVFDRYGGFIDMWTDVRTPASLAQLADGNIAVCEHPSDYFLDEIDFSVPFYITIFSPDGEVQAKLPAGFAHSMALDSQGNIYLANHHTVHKCVRLD
ncbi:hypothetical protein [Dactylosporangium sp. CA-092794]|uniref:hypothetical protein n=1 Tax=Dactylosporangium sp. CA-092794 TaxID=3239929 RepID=UPI003D8F5ABF